MSNNPGTTHGKLEGVGDRLSSSKNSPSSQQMGVSCANSRLKNLQIRRTETNYSDKIRNKPQIVVTKPITRMNSTNSQLKYSSMCGSNSHSNHSHGMAYKFIYSPADSGKGYEIGSRGNAAGIRQQRRASQQLSNAIFGGNMGSKKSSELSNAFSKRRESKNMISAPVMNTFQKKLTFGRR